MRVLVFGAGAIGSFFGGLLSHRNEVTLVGRAEHVQAIRKHGLRIEGRTARIARPTAVTRVPRGARADLVLVATKAYDTKEAMTHLAPLTESALFLTLQNGLENPDIIARTARHVAAGTTTHGVTFLRAGEVRHAGSGDTVIGPWRDVGPEDLVRLRDVLDEAGIPTRLTDDVRTELWAKLIVNASINPLAALAGVPNGRLLRDRRLEALLETVCIEATSVAQAERARLSPEELLGRTKRVARRTAANRASMLQDLDAGRPTEIEAITGAVVRAAERHGIPLPVNRALHALVSAREGRARVAP